MNTLYSFDRYVVSELLDTEQSYVQDLGHVVTVRNINIMTINLFLQSLVVNSNLFILFIDNISPGTLLSCDSSWQMDV